MMQSGSRNSHFLSKKLTLLKNKFNCDKLDHFKNSPKVTLSDQYRSQHGSLPSPSPKAFVNLFNDRFEWFNNHYERITGVSELRQIHVKVIEAETKYKDITKRRKSCQDQIDALSEKVQNTRDKLDTTNRSSDSYLRLITTEHQLLKERHVLEVELAQLKEKEQTSFDDMSEHLRQNFTLERLRQERARYMNIITLCLSVVGSMVALISQRRRDQRRLDSILVENNGKLESISEQLDEICKSIDRFHIPEQQSPAQPSVSGWSAYVPGLYYLTSLYGYFF